MTFATAFVLLLLVLQAPQQAPPTAAANGLKATIRLNIAKVDVPANAPVSPLGNMGALIAQLLTPDGPVEIDYLIAGDATRGEVRGRLAAFPRGTIVLQHLHDDAIKVLNPDNKTWYELPATASLGAQIGAPDVQMEPTGETAMIAGQRAERFRFVETLRFPAPEGANLPSDFPTSIDLSGDVWSTDAFSGSGYAGIFQTLQAASAIPGMEALTAGGRFPLRIAVRSTMMAGYEIRSDVLTIGAAQPAASMFEIPRDYQQVRGPARR
jgi:hypothetical protein